MRSKKYLVFLGIILLLTGCGNKTYTVSFNTDGGTIMESVEVNKGEILENIEPPTKEGYLFVNWLKDGVEYQKNTPIKDDFTLTANWVEAPEVSNYYQVTFISGNNVAKVSVKENEVVTPPEATPLENHNFVGWFSGEEEFDFETKITKNISLTAKYELSLVTVTYKLEGGIGLSIETIPKGTTLTIPSTPFKPGYKFLKWTLNGEQFSFDTPVKEDIMLTAVWQEIEYVVISFDTDGGSEIESLKLEKNSPLTAVETPVKEGYTFIEWQLDGKKFDLDAKIEEDITIKAIYRANETKETE